MAVSVSLVSGIEMSNHWEHALESITTSLGKVSFTVKTVEGDISAARIILKEIQPFLPKGMEVESSIAALLKVKSSHAIKGLEFAYLGLDW